jgi:uncharacterized protein DUF4158
LGTAELEILPDRGDHNRFGFAVLLKFIEIEGCFPSSPREVPAAAPSHLASQLRIPPTAFIRYDWTGCTGKRHSSQLSDSVNLRSFFRITTKIYLYLEINGN